MEVVLGRACAHELSGTKTRFSLYGWRASFAGGSGGSQIETVAAPYTVSEPIEPPSSYKPCPSTATSLIRIPRSAGSATSLLPRSSDCWPCPHYRRPH